MTPAPDFSSFSSPWIYFFLLLLLLRAQVKNRPVHLSLVSVLLSFQLYDDRVPTTDFLLFSFWSDCHDTYVFNPYDLVFLGSLTHLLAAAHIQKDHTHVYLASSTRLSTISFVAVKYEVGYQIVFMLYVGSYALEVSLQPELI